MKIIDVTIKEKRAIHLSQKEKASRFSTRKFANPGITI